jgi:hypothetical protein
MIESRTQAAQCAWGGSLASRFSRGDHPMKLALHRGLEELGKI